MVCPVTDWGCEVAARVTDVVGTVEHLTARADLMPLCGQGGRGKLFRVNRSGVATRKDGAGPVKPLCGGCLRVLRGLVALADVEPSRLGL